MKNKIAISLLVIVIVVLLAGTITMHNMMQRGFSTRTPPTAMEKTLATTIREKAIPAKYAEMRDPVASSPAVLHEAEAHYADHCAVCHANNGSGATMFGKMMYPRPPDMRLEDTQSMSDGEIYYTIKNGIRLSGMPAFGDPTDSDVDTWKLVHFIRHLPRLTPAEEAEMQKLNPKSPDEIQEEKDEENFLNGGQGSATPTTKTHHH
jgi:mono/diheme cytochrome c family protein